MTEKMEVNTISKHGWNLKGQTIRGKFFGNMENHLFSMLVFVLIVLMSLISCKHEPDENKPGNEVDLDIFAVDISAETDWNYMVVGKDGSSMVFNADESTGIPSLLYLKPEKDSDDGFTYLFKENGLPDKLIHNGHILYFGNFSGYTFDLAVIYPNDTIEYHYGIETDINWDAYNETSPSGQPRSILDIFSNPYVKHGIGVGTCIAGVFYAPLLIGCTSYVGKLYVDTVTTYAFPELDGAPADVIKAIIDVFGCAGGAIGNCVSGAAEALHLLTYLDFNLAEQKTTQINEAIRRIDGDVLTLIPRELLEYFYDLGITINSGRNPPNIEGTYLVPTLQLMRKTTSTNITEQWDKYVTFSRQDSTSLTVNVDYIMQSDNGSMSLSGLGFIVGEGNKYTVVIDGTREEEGYTARTIEAFSGEITATGISDYQWGIFMVDNRGDPLGHWIANGTGYSKRGTAVKFDPNQPGLANNPVPLTADTWTTGSITSGGLNEIWYSFNVVSGTSYSIGWSDSYEGAGSHTLDIVVSAQYENGTSIFSGTDSAYYTPRIFIANQTSIVKIRVSPYYSGGTGTYALTYSIGSTAIRPSALITTFSERTLSVNHVQGIKEASSKTVPSGARN